MVLRLQPERVCLIAEGGKTSSCLSNTVQPEGCTVCCIYSGVNYSTTPLISMFFTVRALLLVY